MEWEMIRVRLKVKGAGGTFSTLECRMQEELEVNDLFRGCESGCIRTEGN